MQENRKASRDLVEHEYSTVIGMSRHRRKDNIKIEH
jgi:hypothetical protein